MIKGNVRKPAQAVDAKRNSSLPRERELELMNENDMLKKRIREIEVPLEERKTFRSRYSRNQKDQAKCFSCGKLRQIERNCFSKRSRNNVFKNQKKKVF